MITETIPPPFPAGRFGEAPPFSTHCSKPQPGASPTRSAKRSESGIPCAGIFSSETEGETSESFPEFSDDPFFLRRRGGLEGDGEADMGTGFVPRDSGDQVLADEPLGEVFPGLEFEGAVGTFSGLGSGDVEEEGALGFGGLKSEGLEEIDEEIHPSRILRGNFFGDFRVVEGVGGRVLDAKKLAGIGVVFDIAVGADEEWIAGNEAATPTGHVKCFAGGMEFHADIDGSGHAEKAERFAFEDERGIGGVVDDDEGMFFREFDDPRKEFGCGGSSGGVVGIIEDQSFGFGEDVGRDGLEIREKMIFFGKGKVVNDSAVVFCVSAEDGIAGCGHEGDLSRVDEGGGQDAESGFAADGMANVLGGIEIDTANRFHVAGGSFFEAGAAVVGIAAIFGIGSFVGEGLDDFGESHFVGFANAEIEELGAGISFESGPFGSFDFLKFVNGGVESVAGSSNSVCE